MTQFEIFAVVVVPAIAVAFGWGVAIWALRSARAAAARGE